MYQEFLNDLTNNLKSIIKTNIAYRKILKRLKRYNDIHTVLLQRH